VTNPKIAGLPAGGLQKNKGNKMKFTKSTLVVAAIGTCLLSGCTSTKPACGCGGAAEDSSLLAPAKKITLPDAFNSPDGMTIGKDGNVYLSINNVSDQSYPAKIARISSDGQVNAFCDLPAHPETGLVSPLGIVFGSDGNLYVADNQSFVTNAPGFSRLLRIDMKNGKAVGTDVVLTGLTMANGVSAYGDYIVVNESAIDKTYPLKSGTYRFSIDELKQGPIQVTGLNDPHLIVRLETRNQEHQVGANGVGFDSKGNMYVCNFGDAEIWKATFKKNGDVDQFSLLCKGQGMASADGLQVDAEDNLWVADFLGNAIFRICSQCGTARLIAKNEPGDGADGSMDAPSECIRRGNTVYVSNIDLTYGPNTADDVHSISVYELP
jgi:sugar lactone lactonase YvrE